MYKPNFCADCGAKIIRARWHVWTSRRFCPDCEGRFRKAQFLAPLLMGALLLSIGLALGRATRPPAPPLTVERGELPTVTDGKRRNDAAETEGEADASSSTAPKAEPKYGPDGTATERPTDPEEIVSICGARTQKGTPCRRRVRGTGRCWQHRVMP
jgi:hypothetical protein